MEIGRFHDSSRPVAFVFSAMVVVAQLRNVRHDRFVQITNGLFQTWRSPDFMKPQQWVINEMPISRPELKRAWNRS